MEIFTNTLHFTVPIDIEMHFLVFSHMSQANVILTSMILSAVICKITDVEKCLQH